VATVAMIAPVWTAPMQIAGRRVARLLQVPIDLASIDLVPIDLASIGLAPSDLVSIDLVSIDLVPIDLASIGLASIGLAPSGNLAVKHLARIDQDWTVPRRRRRCRVRALARFVHLRNNRESVARQRLSRAHPCRAPSIRDCNRRNPSGPMSPVPTCCPIRIARNLAVPRRADRTRVKRGRQAANEPSRRSNLPRARDCPRRRR
jgi:hypothetical protein